MRRGGAAPLKRPRGVSVLDQVCRTGSALAHRLRHVDAATIAPTHDARMAPPASTPAPQGRAARPRRSCIESTCPSTRFSITAHTEDLVCDECGVVQRRQAISKQAEHFDHKDEATGVKQDRQRTSVDTTPALLERYEAEPLAAAYQDACTKGHQELAKQVVAVANELEQALTSAATPNKLRALREIGHLVDAGVALDRDPRLTACAILLPRYRVYGVDLNEATYERAARLAGLAREALQKEVARLRPEA